MNPNQRFNDRGEDLYRFFIPEGRGNFGRPIMRCQVCERTFLRINRNRHLRSRAHLNLMHEVRRRERVGQPPIPAFGLESPNFRYFVDVGYDNRGRRRKFCRLCNFTMFSSNARRHAQRRQHQRRFEQAEVRRQLGLPQRLADPPVRLEQNWNRPLNPVRFRRMAARPRQAAPAPANNGEPQVQPPPVPPHRDAVLE